MNTLAGVVLCMGWVGHLYKASAAIVALILFDAVVPYVRISIIRMCKYITLRFSVLFPHFLVALKETLY